MSTRQYIGARYVPKFFDDGNGSSEWVNGLSYEALTVVTHLGNSFTSKKPVPAGVDIMNTEYWCVTGAYNEQVESYREIAVQTKKDLGIEITERKNSESKLFNLINRKFLFIGDSYGDNPRVNTTWGKELADTLGLKDDQWDNLCSSGARWDNTNIGYKSYLQEITEYSGDKESITDIVLCGGANDTDYTDIFSTITQAIIKFSNYAKENYPNAKLWLAWVGFGTELMKKESTVEAYNAYKVCGSGRFSYIKNSITGFHNYSHLEDNVLHPNATGCKTIAWTIASALNGGEVACSTYDKDLLFPKNSLSGITGVNNTVSGSAYRDFYDDNYRVKISRMLLNYTSPIDLTNDKPVKLHTLNSNFFRPNIGENEYSFSGNISYSENGTSFTSINGYFSVKYETDNTYVIFRPSIPNEITNVKYILYSLEFMYPLVRC